jgi:vacuolar-type H+-ATPase subunit F/Vma7
MEGKIAVLGDTDFVLPFSALGLDTFAVEQAPTEIADSAKKIIAEKYALVVVAENIAPKAEAVFADYRNKPTPCVVVVPFTTESEGYATQALGEVLKMATGINILKND